MSLSEKSGAPALSPDWSDNEVGGLEARDWESFDVDSADVTWGGNSNTPRVFVKSVTVGGVVAMVVVSFTTLLVISFKVGLGVASLKCWQN